ncbi:MAG: FIST C-terminal domain-containing protein [Burkholderiaceae bacterium]
MQRFPSAHATHPQWRMAAALVLAQLRAQMDLPDHPRSPSLGLLYITDHYAAEAEALVAFLGEALPEVADWVGTVGVGVAGSGVEYFDEPALSVMLCDLAPDSYRVFSGVAPLPPSGRHGRFEAHTARVHADGHTPELAELIVEVADRTRSGYLFGGLCASRGASVQFALSSRGHLQGQGGAGGVFHGGLSGVAFGPDIGIVSRVTQGAQPVAAAWTVTEAEGHLVLGLDGQPAMEQVLDSLEVSLEQPQEAIERLRRTLVGVTPPDGQEAEAGTQDRERRGQFGPEVLVRHIIGLDPARQGVAIADQVAEGSRLALCERHVQAARADLVRICTEIREELEPQVHDLPLGHPVMADAMADLPADVTERIAGAVYVSCSGRGGPHFGAPSAELQIVRRALGDVPLVGFFAGGEIAHHQLYGYTGVLTVFVRPEH